MIGGIGRNKEEDDRKGLDLSKRSTVIDLGKGTVRIIGTLKGLDSERTLVKEAFRVDDPEVVGLHIGKEEIMGLEAVVKGEVETTYLSSYEKVYARELSRFGKVIIPPPSLVEAYRISSKDDIPVKPLDFNEKDYTTIYTELIDGLTMMRQSLRLKSINRKKFSSDSAEEFIIEWDRVVNKFKGFRKLERRREERMAKSIIALSNKFERVLAIVEYERMEGIIDLLRE